MIFHSYVSLPEGNRQKYGWLWRKNKIAIPARVWALPLTGKACRRWLADHHPEDRKQVPWNRIDWWFGGYTFKPPAVFTSHLRMAHTNFAMLVEKQKQLNGKGFHKSPRRTKTSNTVNRSLWVMIETGHRSMMNYAVMPIAHFEAMIHKVYQGMSRDMIFDMNPRRFPDFSEWPRSKDEEILCKDQALQEIQEACRRQQERRLGPGDAAWEWWWVCELEHHHV